MKPALPPSRPLGMLSQPASFLLVWALTSALVMCPSRIPIFALHFTVLSCSQLLHVLLWPHGQSGSQRSLQEISM